MDGEKLFQMVLNLSDPPMAYDFNRFDQIVGRILKHYVEEERKNHDISNITVLGIDEISVERHQAYVTLFYDIKNSREIHIEEGEESYVFMRFIRKNPFLDTKNMEYITMDVYPSYKSGAKEYFPYSRIVFDHFHVIKMMNDTVDRIRRKEEKDNEILRNTRYDWIKNSSELTNREMERMRSVKSLICRHHPMHTTSRLRCRDYRSRT